MGGTGVMVGSDLRFLTVGTVKRDARGLTPPHPTTAAALLAQRPSPCPSLHAGLPLSRTAGEGSECHEAGKGQPPTTPCVST